MINSTFFIVALLLHTLRQYYQNNGDKKICDIISIESRTAISNTGLYIFIERESDTITWVVYYIVHLRIVYSLVWRTMRPFSLFFLLTHIDFTVLTTMCYTHLNVAQLGWEGGRDDLLDVEAKVYNTPTHTPSPMQKETERDRELKILFEKKIND